MKELTRGAIYIVNLPDASGSIQTKQRPAVLISNNLANRYSSVLHICPLTSVTTKSKLPTHIPVSMNCGLLRDSIALCEQTMLVTKDCVIKDKIGVCDEETMKRIDHGLMVQFNLIQTNKKEIEYA
ncbi:MAG: hypothetical protein A2Y34_07090 [Spirochaetes bacterium GWC1_27_15]|nr:MAG: hypothetical protein A2Y34_07090 [Spirochaetes bacterium GWC1_27_15]